MNNQFKKIVCIKSDIVHSDNHNYIKWYENSSLPEIQRLKSERVEFISPDIKSHYSDVFEFRKRFYKNNYVKGLGDLINYMPEDVSGLNFYECDEYIELYMYVAIRDSKLKFIESIITKDKNTTKIDKDNYIEYLKEQNEDLIIKNDSFKFTAYLITFFVVMYYLINY